MVFVDGGCWWLVWRRRLVICWLVVVVGGGRLVDFWLVGRLGDLVSGLGYRFWWFGVFWLVGNLVGVVGEVGGWVDTLVRGLRRCLW